MTGWQRWYTYQKERFPLAGHGPLIAVFSASAVCFSCMLRAPGSAPRTASLVVAFVTCLLFFLQLRIADEFKDFEDDSRWRPYRAVPRGLVTLGQLRLLFILTAAIQAALALGYYPWLLVLLGITWTYLALMSVEFFARDWLKNRPILYMTSHMAIMPLVDLYATATDWLPVQSRPPAGLMWFLFASYFNGLVIEIGRKIRVPADEEEGVETYSALWGRPAAIAAWVGVMSTCGICAVLAARHVNFMAPVAAIAGAVILAAAAAGVMISRSTKPGKGKLAEIISGVWTLLLYTTLGIAPLVLQLVKGT